MAVKVEINGIGNVKESIKKLFEEVKKDKELLDQIGMKTVEQFRSYNRAGKSPDGTKHRALEQSWIDKKDQLSKNNTQSEFFYRGAPNMTFTGQLLNAIRFVADPNTGSVTVDVKNTKHTPYKGGSQKSLTNRQIADFLAEGVINKHGELKQRFVIPKKNAGIAKQIENTIVKVVRSFLNLKIRKSIFKSSKD